MQAALCQSAIRNLHSAVVVVAPCSWSNCRYHAAAAAALHGLEQIFRRRLATSGWFETARAQYIAHGMADSVVALERRGSGKRQQSGQFRQGSHLAEGPRKLRDEGAEVEQGVGIEGQHKE